MNRLGILLSTLIFLAAFMPAAASAADPVAVATPYLVVEGVAAMKVPSTFVTWTVTPLHDGEHRWKVTVHDADGSVYGALRLENAELPPIAVVVHEVPLGLPEQSPADIRLLSNCTGTVHGYTLCADISYAGGSGAVWNQGWTYGQSEGYYCYNCLTIQGCYEALFTFCDREARFTVEGSSTGASVCWTWGAWRDVWTKAIYDGVSVTSDRVWVTATTTC